MPQQFIDWLGHRNIARMPRSYGDQVSADLVGINHARLTVPHETTLTKINFTVIGAPTPVGSDRLGPPVGLTGRHAAATAASFGRWHDRTPRSMAGGRYFARNIHPRLGISFGSSSPPRRRPARDPPFCLPQRKWDRAYGGRRYCSAIRRSSFALGPRRSPARSA
jgi:hypothetical protein